MLGVIILAILVSAQGELFCPSANDLVVAYGTPQFFDQGWSTQGGGATATKASFNLLGGWVEYDVDFSGVHTGVNANVYTICPTFSGSFQPKVNYCDGAKTGSDWCVEVDWIETNGNCGGQTTLHTREGPGSNGCTAWGCANSYHYNGRSAFRMRINYGDDGTWTTVRDGQTIGPNNLNPPAQGQDWSILKQQYQSKGAVIYSSQWVGWVPLPDCGQTGDLPSSFFKVSNLRINGTVVQGTKPKVCSGPQPPSTGTCCYTGCDPSSCNIAGTYCTQSQDNCVKDCKGNWCA